MCVCIRCVLVYIYDEGASGRALALEGLGLLRLYDDLMNDILKILTTELVRFRAGCV